MKRLFYTLCRDDFPFGHSCSFHDVKWLVLLLCGSGNECSILWSESQNRRFQLNSKIVRTHYASIMALNKRPFCRCGGHFDFCWGSMGCSGGQISMDLPPDHPIIGIWNNRNQNGRHIRQTVCCETIAETRSYIFWLLYRCCRHHVPSNAKSHYLWPKRIVLSLSEYNVRTSSLSTQLAWRLTLSASYSDVLDRTSNVVVSRR